MQCLATLGFNNLAALMYDQEARVSFVNRCQDPEVGAPYLHKAAVVFPHPIVNANLYFCNVASCNVALQEIYSLKMFSHFAWLSGIYLTAAVQL